MEKVFVCSVVFFRTDARKRDALIVTSDATYTQITSLGPRPSSCRLVAQVGHNLSIHAHVSFYVLHQIYRGDSSMLHRSCTQTYTLQFLEGKSSYRSIQNRQTDVRDSSLKWLIQFNISQWPLSETWLNLSGCFSHLHADIPCRMIGINTSEPLLQQQAQWFVLRINPWDFWFSACWSREGRNMFQGVDTAMKRSFFFLHPVLKPLLVYISSAL